MASKQQIQQAIQAASNAGAASGYAQALEDVVNNLAQSEVSWLSERGSIDEKDMGIGPRGPHALMEQLSTQIDTSAAIRSQIESELERRRLEAKSRQSIAESCMLEVGASPFRAARLAISKALGGAARWLAAP